MNQEENKNNDIFMEKGVFNYSFVKDSIPKMGVFCFLVSIFYPIGWFYKQWKAIKKNNESYKNISPLWRGILYPIYIFSFAKIVSGLLQLKKAEEFNSPDLTEEQKTNLAAEYKKLEGAKSAPYLILAALVIMAIVTVFLDSMNIRIGGAIVALVFAALAFLQKAINKVLPANHPEASAVSASDFLCVPFFIIFFGFLLVWVLFSELMCVTADGNVLTSCNKYSLTYPFNTELSTKDSGRYNVYCQTSEDEKESLCSVEGEFKPEEFTMEEILKNHKPISKFTKQYANNTTHCVTEKEEDVYYTTCYAKVERKEPIYIIFMRNAENNNLTNLEKLMESYKEL